MSLLNSVKYDKRSAIATLERELGYRKYGDKHHESIDTRFFQSYILPKKFGIDKWRAHFSSLIMTEQLTRDEALCRLAEPIGHGDMVREVLEYVTKKLGLTAEQFDAIMSQPPRSYRDFRNEADRYERLKALMRRAQAWNLLPRQIGM